MSNQPVPGKGGDRYVPYEERNGDESIVYFTRDLSPEGLMKVYDRVCGVLTGRIAVKLHTGEKYGPNIIPRPWVKKLFAERLQDASIVETNTFYIGDRYTTEEHLETLKVNGWTFCPVDITDAEGTALLPVKGGKWFTEMSVGKTLPDYDSLLALTHFKGHVMGGFGGSNKNIGIGCADGRVGKMWIHSNCETQNDFSIDKEELMERISESTKATVDYFAGKCAFVNVMRNMTVSCDCEGTQAAPVKVPDVGILASLDVLAVDQACMDLLMALPENERTDLTQRITTRHGFRQLTYMKELGMGNERYQLLDLDNGDAVITAADAVQGIRGPWEPDQWMKLQNQLWRM